MTNFQSKCAVCSCVHFRLEDGELDYGPSGNVEIKVYFTARKTHTRPWLWLLDQSFQTTAPNNTIDGGNSNIRTTTSSSLLNFEAHFDHASGFVNGLQHHFIDIAVDTQISVVKVEVIDKILSGRVTTISGGKKCFGDTDKTAQQIWHPTWTRVVPFTNNHGDDGLVAALYPPMQIVKSKEGEESNVRFLHPRCDVLRLSLEFNDNSCGDSQKQPWFLHQIISNTSTTVIPFDDCIINEQIMMAATEHHQSSPPLSDLPLGVWQKIAENLPHSAFVALSGTCRQLRHVFNHPLFYSTIDLKPFAPMAGKEIVDFFTDRCQNTQHLRLTWLPDFNILTEFLARIRPGSLTSFVADRCPALDDNFLVKLVERQPNIELLRLVDCYSVTSNGYAIIAKLSKLQHLSFGCGPKIEAASLREIVADCEQLETFEGPIFVDPNDPTAIDDVLTLLADVNGNNLRAVHLWLVDFDEENTNDLSDLLDQVFLPKCPRLEEFQVEQCHSTISPNKNPSSCLYLN